MLLQLVANCLSLLIGAEQVAYSDFLDLFHCEQLQPKTKLRTEKQGAEASVKLREARAMILWRLVAASDPVHVAFTVI